MKKTNPPCYPGSAIDKIEIEGHLVPRIWSIWYRPRAFFPIYALSYFDAIDVASVDEIETSRITEPLRKMKECDSRLVSSIGHIHSVFEEPTDETTNRNPVCAVPIFVFLECRVQYQVCGMKNRRRNSIPLSSSKCSEVLLRELSHYDTP
jgi:hypothetical protein